jgi:hypothetical protein
MIAQLGVFSRTSRLLLLDPHQTEVEILIVLLLSWQAHNMVEAHAPPKVEGEVHLLCLDQRLTMLVHKVQTCIVLFLLNMANHHPLQDVKWIHALTQCVQVKNSFLCFIMVWNVIFRATQMSLEP